MKPATVINQGDNFVTLRATTDRPAEIREALAAREVLHVFKGDQNQAWDAVLANHCLARAVGESASEITFFIQDERLGTCDARLARHFRKQGRRYVLTEDYYRGRAGAVWEHQDISHGLFFTEAVSPEQYAAAGLPLHRLAAEWVRLGSSLTPDAGWDEALRALGVALPAADTAADAVTRLGPAVNREEMREAFSGYPDAALYYALTKTDGLYGVVPVENENVILSSIPASEPELRAAGAWLLVRAAAAGAMRMAAGASHRRAVKARARALAAWGEELLRDYPAASLADFQAALGRWLTAQVFPSDRVDLDRASHFNGISRAELDDLRRPEETLHFFLDLALRHPGEFTDAYNEALNRVGYGLQRMKYRPETGEYAPPFFVEFAPGGHGTPVYRFGIELSGVERTTITLSNPSAGSHTVQADGLVRSAYDFARALLDHLPSTAELAIVGKAATFAAEMQRSPRGLGLPRQGSKYTPMVDHLLGGLRARGVLRHPTGLLIRIGLNALDRLSALGELPLRLPVFLRSALGPSALCREIALRWREVAAEARADLELLARCEPGQQVHLARLLCLNARGGDLSAARRVDPRLEKLCGQLGADPEARERLERLGRELPAAAVECIERLLAEREELLERRRRRLPERRRLSAEAGSPRILSFPEDTALEEAVAAVDLRLELLCAAWVRRLWQRAESLPYVNDRPYTLALYLLFGPDVFYPICREVEFDVEYLTPVPPEAAPGSHCAERRFCVRSD
ncbi:MAG: hypothetical protein ACK47B_11390 [Armatimonadota bacterium]